MLFYETPWHSMKFHYVPCISMEFGRTPWNFIGFHDIPWNSTMFFETLWCSMIFQQTLKVFRGTPSCSVRIHCMPMNFLGFWTTTWFSVDSVLFCGTPWCSTVVATNWKTLYSPDSAFQLVATLQLFDVLTTLEIFILVISFQLKKKRLNVVDHNILKSSSSIDGNDPGGTPHGRANFKHMVGGRRFMGRSLGGWAFPLSKDVFCKYIQQMGLRLRIHQRDEGGIQCESGEFI